MEKQTPIYDGDPAQFRWVGFGSGSGTNLRELAKIYKPSLIVTDRPKAKLLKLEELKRIPTIIENGYKFCKKRPNKDTEPELFEQYEKRSVEFNNMLLGKIEEHEKKLGHEMDLIVLGGYMRFVGGDLLEKYKDRMINVHPGDLSILHMVDGKFVRKYIGVDAVTLAIQDGVRSTKSSVIIVDKGEDHGEILTQGNIQGNMFPYSKLTLDEYCDIHQDFQKEVSDWPAIKTALTMIKDGRFALGEQKRFKDEWRTVYVDGKPIHHSGYQI